MSVVRRWILPAQTGVTLDDVGVAYSVHDPGRRFFLQLHFALAFPDRTFGVVIYAVLFEQLLQLRGLLVAEVEETIARMVGVQAEFGAIGANRALRPHHESFATTAAEFIFTLAAGEMHATYENSRVSFQRAPKNMSLICISNNLEKISPFHVYLYI